MDSSVLEEKHSSNIDNSHLESDSSIGKDESVNWTTRQVIAAVSLSILWVGEFLVLPLGFEPFNNMFRLAGSPLFYWGHAIIYDR